MLIADPLAWPVRTVCFREPRERGAEAGGQLVQAGAEVGGLGSLLTLMTFVRLPIGSGGPNLVAQSPAVGVCVKGEHVAEDIPSGGQQTELVGIDEVLLAHTQADALVDRRSVLGEPRSLKSSGGGGLCGPSELDWGEG